MRKLDWKSFARGVLLTTTLLFGVGATQKTVNGIQKVVVVQPPEISIHDAIKNTHIETVRQHLAAGTNIDARNSKNETPLYTAVKLVRVTFEKEILSDIIQLLVSEGADVNAKMNFGETALHRTIDQAVAELIISKGANVNSLTSSGYTPMDYHVSGSNPKNLTANFFRKYNGKTGKELGAP